MYEIICIRNGFDFIKSFGFFCQQPSYRLAIRTEGMIEDLVKNLKSQSDELQMHCASAIFKVLFAFCCVQVLRYILKHAKVYMNDAEQHCMN